MVPPPSPPPALRVPDPPLWLPPGPAGRQWGPVSVSLSAPPAFSTAGHFQRGGWGPPKIGRVLGPRFRGSPPLVPRAFFWEMVKGATESDPPALATQGIARPFPRSSPSRMAPCWTQIKGLVPFFPLAFPLGHFPGALMAPPNGGRVPAFVFFFRDPAFFRQRGQGFFHLVHFLFSSKTFSLR